MPNEFTVRYDLSAGSVGYRRRFATVMAAAVDMGWRVWIAPSSHEATGGYVVHTRGLLSGREHHKYLPEAVVAATWWLADGPLDRTSAETAPERPADQAQNGGLDA